MSSYLNNQIYIQLRNTEKQIADRINSLTNILPMIVDKDRKISILKELAQEINRFDDHLRYIIKKFPNYFTDYKDVILPIFTENNNFLHSTLKEINNLSKSKPN